mmetsp:Transcript_13405/g.26275  ORF Transcript_13405/g.26275 Transcript_13405/m.26275 type:complete len:108 (-) Transcript_13405:87-410(-)
MRCCFEKVALRVDGWWAVMPYEVLWIDIGSPELQHTTQLECCEDINNKQDGDLDASCARGQRQRVQALKIIIIMPLVQLVHHFTVESSFNRRWAPSCRCANGRKRRM